MKVLLHMQLLYIPYYKEIYILDNSRRKEPTGKTILKTYQNPISFYTFMLHTQKIKNLAEIRKSARKLGLWSCCFHLVCSDFLTSSHLNRHLKDVINWATGQLRVEKFQGKERLRAKNIRRIVAKSVVESCC